MLDIPLDSEVEVSRIWQLIIYHKTRNALYRLENRPVSWRAYWGLHKREPLSRIGGIPSLEWLFEINERRTLPVLGEWWVPQFEVVLDLLEGGCVNPACCADACLTRAAK